MTTLDEKYIFTAKAKRNIAILLVVGILLLAVGIFMNMGDATQGEEEHAAKKNYCSLCGTKMGLFRYNPKPKWKIDGQLCRKCWDVKKAEFG